MAPFPFMKLPLEIRHKIYRHFTDPLRGWTHERNWQLADLCRAQDMVFHIAGRAWDPKARDNNLVYDLAVTDPVDQRTLDTHAPWADQQPADVHAAYAKIQDGTALPDEIPTGWLATTEMLCLMAGRDIRDSTDSSETSSEGFVAMDVDDGDTHVREAGPAGYHTIIQPRMHVPADSKCVYHPSLSPSQPDTDTEQDTRERMSQLRRDGIRCTCPHTIRADYAAIRRLAQVSPQMTQELGSVLWQGAVLVFPGGPEDFALFARNRPAVLGRVRGIRLAVSCNGDVFDTVTSELAEMLHAVAERCCVLRFFWVDVCIDASVLLSGSGNSGEEGRSRVEMRAWERIEKWTPLFRGLRAEGFRVDLEVHGKEVAVGRERMEAVNRAMVELWELWKPDRVREVEGERERKGKERLRYEEYRVARGGD
ncbi:hypothetical protein B0T22DRAFT_167838 [Podospora appendiculata]|uniref:Uncharacterized protein n=1 Tax=Podospora appendiculata TaxID=314037 RepID=A0AAE0XAL3_9PEZI|nr:hypothetical protein B0T22DRAFT_167838 [Podospora appendiculata]